LESHDILLAEGLPAESYLDVGNRTAFANAGAVIDQHPDFGPLTGNGTCLPVHVDGPVVAAAKGRLLARAEQLGHALTEDADIHILADGGRIDPIVIGAGVVAFVLPPGCARVVLMTRSFVAGQTIANNTDTRSLGVCVTRLEIDGTACAMDALSPDGWHPAEPLDDGRVQRWTNGTTPLPPRCRLVLLHTAGPAFYWRDDPDEARGVG
jgi:hypothetical protein